ncbi:MAG: UDP-N-acetylmuramate--L-alanine ligase [Patescibacteria group bacterium]|nr:UDP-N-acetylmuramate--L-alanine ligase [Patescibacteria group bacterium]
MQLVTNLNIDTIHSVYLIGVKGSAMTALAEILVARGIKVSGSDVTDVFYTDALLKKVGVKIYKGFSKKNIPQQVDLIIHSTAYNKNNNIEIATALKAKRILINCPEAIGLIFNQLFGIAVCGTHGKTTTSAMLAEILRGAGMNPTALIGSKVINWGSASLSGDGQHFIIEADEYQNKLQYYNPKMVVVTNIDYDHPDFFKSRASYVKVFKDFFRKIPAKGFLIANSEDKKSQEIANNLTCQCVNFGNNQKAGFKLISREVVATGGQKITFSIPKGEEVVFNLKLLGEHNALNALTAITAAYQLGVTAKKATKILENFKSSERRLQKIKNFSRGVLYDDYAHHPREIKMTLKAIRERYPSKKIIVAFHPHTFSRTKKFFKAFGQALTLADQVYILDIYSSAREMKSEAEFNSEHLAGLVNQLGGKAEHIPTIEKLAPVIVKEMNENSVFISMGAGDVWKIHALIK